MEPSNLFVVLMGLSIVFIGLICIIALCSVTGFFCRHFTHDTPAVSQNAIKEVPAPQSDIPNRQEFIAAVSAVIAEELGTDVNGIKICSVKKL